MRLRKNIPFSSSAVSERDSPAFFFFFPLFLVPLLLTRYGTLTCKLRMHVRLVLPLLKVPLGTDTLDDGEAGNNWERGLNGAEPWPRGTVTTCGSLSYRKRKNRRAERRFCKSLLARLSRTCTARSFTLNLTLNPKLVRFSLVTETWGTVEKKFLKKPVGRLTADCQTIGSR